MFGDRVIARDRVICRQGKSIPELTRKRKVVVGKFYGPNEEAGGCLQKYNKIEGL
jgi:hypothetical protein